MTVSISRLRIYACSLYHFTMLYFHLMCQFKIFYDKNEYLTASFSFKPNCGLCEIQIIFNYN